MWTPPGEGWKGRFALDVACKTLSFFTKCAQSLPCGSLADHRQ